MCVKQLFFFKNMNISNLVYSSIKSCFSSIISYIPSFMPFDYSFEFCRKITHFHRKFLAPKSVLPGNLNFSAALQELNTQNNKQWDKMSI